MGVKVGGKVERVNGKEISYKEFTEKYLVKNEPVVLTGLMDDWKACKDWVTSDGKPNLNFFSTHFGKSLVQVEELAEQKRVEMSVADFIKNWLDSDESLLYLKDWHFVKEYPEYIAYTTPLFFRDDWLNLYLNSYHMHTDTDTYQEKNEISCSDYRFVYMGTKGTWTPLHADVFRSYSWSANVCGKKQWHFLSPSQCHHVFDRSMKNSVYDIFGDVSETKFPGFKKDDTISINHNWFNAHNLSWVWKLLHTDYKVAKEYIEDIQDICDNFEDLCQRNLAANTGMNFCDFFSFIVRFSFASLILLYLSDKVNHKPMKGTLFSTQHVLSNLRFIKQVALSMKSVEALNENTSSLLEVREVLKEPLFVELCKDLERTYKMIYEQWEQRSDTNGPSIVNFDELELDKAAFPRVCRPEDLVRMIDFAFTHFGVESGLEDCCDI
ncbi:hypothetical protein IFM89_012694 [Coptis chinensis]|uniref:JmjC domain-containing protein n=1 Tax=Coptis chinensis TaxID=261450 RepID=A0A835IWM7_9MAGN|nr:hypothetical protein IFM89_012694 [Coptis chinensis]